MPRYVVRSNPTREALPLSQDPIGDKFDRCVAKVSPKLGEQAAHAICAKSLNRAYPGALPAAVSRAAAERRAGLRPPRAPRGSQRTSGGKAAGDVRAGDAFVLPGRKTVHQASANATARETRRGYVTELRVTGGRTITVAPETRVRVLQRVGANPGRSGTRRVHKNPVWDLIQVFDAAPGVRVVEWVDVDDATWQVIPASSGQRPPLKPGHHLVTHGAVLVLDQKQGASFARVLFVRRHGGHWMYLGPLGPRLPIGSSKLPPRDQALARKLAEYLMREMREHAGLSRGDGV